MLLTIVISNLLYISIIPYMCGIFYFFSYFLYFISVFNTIPNVKIFLNIKKDVLLNAFFIKLFFSYVFLFFTLFIHFMGQVFDSKCQSFLSTSWKDSLITINSNFFLLFLSFLNLLFAFNVLNLLIKHHQRNFNTSSPRFKLSEFHPPYYFL